jgi:1,2-diacylglycerol 3-alpha-glucosyltransferase
LQKTLKDNTILVITSDGPQKKNIENLCKDLSLTGKVIFTGYLDKEKLDDYYSMADIFVMASKTETQGIVLFEAMKHQLPVVVLESPVIGSFVKKHKIGVVASRNNFAHSVSRILKNSKLQKKYSLTGKKTAKEYDIRNSVKNLIDFYKNVIASNP